ncbi:conserved hypothetical protein [Thiomonas sp. X19]|uniref:ArdC family protein n=1 Tax=Thiomonas sp. X19 TaxID=1050370 RepID=UPI000B70DA25|nr:zincin-like metallopeptidase domain-containing protein [Thiomonas sp. X19]SCC94445.1 conserved hypothetical protein [Thiomonas sp. X19]
MNEAKPDFRQEFTDKVIDAIESGKPLPWERPWTAGISPQNAISGEEYQGMNRLILAIEMLEKGYADPRFATFKQAQDLGGSVAKGERGVLAERWEYAEFWQRPEVQVKEGETRVQVRAVDGPSATLDTGREVPKHTLQAEHKGKMYPWAQAAQELNLAYSKVFTLFNVAQCNGLKLEPLPALTNKIEPEDRFQSIKDAMARDGLKFETGSAAFYLHSTDSVVTPPANAFKDVGGYQATVLHEIGHATGAEHRLSRDGITGGHEFGSEGYAKEELRAEFFSIFAAMETGITRLRDEQHAAYLQIWIGAASDDKDEFFKAADDAAKAVDYVIGKEHEMLQEREAAQAEPGREFDLGL